MGEAVKHNLALTDKKEPVLGTSPKPFSGYKENLHITRTAR